LAPRQSAQKLHLRPASGRGAAVESHRGADQGEDVKQTRLFAEPAAVPGFRYQAELFSCDEKLSFVRAFERLPFKPFEFHGYLGNRRVVSFGLRYDYSGARLREAAPIPDFLLPLRAIAARFSGQAEDALVHT